jgi:hypothetical protein
MQPTAAVSLRRRRRSPDRFAKTNETAETKNTNKPPDAKMKTKLCRTSRQEGDTQKCKIQSWQTLGRLRGQHP